MGDARLYLLILADIAVAAAVHACGGTLEPADRSDYAPGALRERWLARQEDGPLRRRVVAMANAGVGSLQRAPAERLAETAARYGVPLDPTLAVAMAAHFVEKSEAWLQYNR